MPFNNFFTCGWNCISTVNTIISNISTQKKFLQKNFLPILTAAYEKNDGSLDIADQKKINQYYGLAVPAILGEAFCCLHGRKMNEQERWAATAQGAMTGLFDDFFDKQYLSDQAIKELMSAGETPNKRSNEKLFDEFYKKVLQFSPDSTAVRQTLEKVYDAQVLSKKQEGSTISAAEIESITIYKGGTSLLFYRSVFLPPISFVEEKLLYELGGLMQLCNDIFDVYKDRESNIKTLITATDHIAPVQKYLQEKLSATFELAYEIGFTHRNVKRFLSILSLGIFSRAFVCLDQLKENEMSSNGIFAVNQYSRKQLICDMDTIKNKLRSAKYHMKLISNFGKVRQTIKH